MDILLCQFLNPSVTKVSRPLKGPSDDVGGNRHESLQYVSMLNSGNKRGLIIAGW